MYDLSIVRFVTIFMLTFCWTSICGQYEEDRPGPQVLYDAPSSMCHAAGRAFQCMPPFTNIAEGVDVFSTSTCGSPAKRICRSWLDSENRQKESCDICDLFDPLKSHPATLLTDRHIASNQTCWISGPLRENSPPVNLTLSLHKRFEVYYISLQPCGTIPDSIAIYKSSDFGKTWRPWQYFSTDCYRAFHLPTSNEHSMQITTANLQQVLCFELKPLRKYKGGQADSVIAFSTTIGRPSTQPWSPALIDWMTMTDLRISLLRFPAPPKEPVARPLQQNPFPRYPYRRQLPDFMADPAAPPQPQPGASQTEKDASGILHYAFSDLAVGGRCKCNGHANRCVKENGQIRCDCQHNTEGVDCERCKASYFDRPWARATVKSPNVCKKCDCNLHSNRCKFSKELYLMSGRTSGGVCERCKHSTDGRRCHYCMDGHYRDWTKPLSHEHVCIKCRCHPIGSRDRRMCDKKTGQCQCKEGVTGITCDRCMEGYRQTRSPDQPCARAKNRVIDKENPMQLLISDNFDTSNLALTGEQKCKPCSTRKKRIRFKKYCRKHLVFQATMSTRESHGEFIRFEMKVNQVWRRSDKAWNLIPSRASYQPFPLWIHFEDLRCNCPWIQLGSTFLIITKAKTFNYRGQKELILNHKSIALPWQESWKRRLAKFKRKEKRGKCSKFSRRARILKTPHRRQKSRPSFSDPYMNYRQDPYRRSYQPYPAQPIYDRNRPNFPRNIYDKKN